MWPTVSSSSLLYQPLSFPHRCKSTRDLKAWNPNFGSKPGFSNCAIYLALATMHMIDLTHGCDLALFTVTRSGVFDLTDCCRGNKPDNSFEEWKGLGHIKSSSIPSSSRSNARMKHRVQVTQKQSRARCYTVNSINTESHTGSLLCARYLLTSGCYNPQGQGWGRTEECAWFSPSRVNHLPLANVYSLLPGDTPGPELLTSL